jgi:hypothetical protein
VGGERGDGNVGGAGAARGGVREESGGRGAIGMRGARLKLKRLKLMTAPVGTKKCSHLRG